MIEYFSILGLEDIFYHLVFLFNISKSKNSFMENKPQIKRASGILAHITSLPSQYGIGDLGPSTYDFLHFLARSAQTYWQILPLGPTDQVFGNSPYMTVSAFAGNPLLISPDILFQTGLLSRQDLEGYPLQNQYQVNFAVISKLKNKLLKKAYDKFCRKIPTEFEEFLAQNHWLKNYSLFMALKNQFPEKAWYQWSEKNSSYHPEILRQVEKDQFDLVRYYQFEQFIFKTQWEQLLNYASRLGIKIIGDIPIYVSLDSVDVWENQEIFELEEETGLPTHVAGVPPDYFSKTGQKWGNPLYRWNDRNKIINEKLIKWWKQRFNSVFELVDMARIDHFRGFESYWSIPAHFETAIDGTWRKGPGKAFFKAIFDDLGTLPIIAEDLGEITEEVIRLRDSLNFPGMKILQFAFDGNPDNSFLPYNFQSPDSIIYTGTHDNDTTVGWFLDDRLDDNTRKKIKLLANRNMDDSNSIHQDLIYLALSSTSVVSIFPLQDILGFGGDCRMNTPGVAEGNWVWRCAPEFLTVEIENWLKEKTELFGRGRSTTLDK